MNLLTQKKELIFMNLTKTLTRQETADLLKAMAVNWVLEKTADNKLVFHDDTIAFIKNALNQFYVSKDYELCSISALNENSVLDVLDRVNKYVRYSLTPLKVDYTKWSGGVW